MVQRKKRTLKIILALLGAIIFLLILTSAWLYSGDLTTLKIKTFRFLPYPMALVNGRPILMSDFILRLSTAQKIAGSVDGMPAADETQSAVYKQLVEEAKIAQVAYRHGVSVGTQEISAEYATQAAQADLEGKKNFEELLNSYGLSRKDFESQILRPQLLLANLQIWFNSQSQLNPTAHNLAGSLAEKIRQGEDMATLATANSEDITGKSTGGDLGFVDPADLLLDLREGVANMKTGEVKILVSRFGLHIIKQVAQQGNEVHLLQIFLKTGDFNHWLNQEIKNIKIWKLIKI